MRTLKPRRMWTGREEFTNPLDVVVCGNKKEFADDLCVAVIPLDDVNRLVAAAMSVLPENLVTYIGRERRDVTSEMLTAIGVLPKQKGGRK